jgi:hypothetical protein
MGTGRKLTVDLSPIKATVVSMKSAPSTAALMGVANTFISAAGILRAKIGSPSLFALFDPEYSDRKVACQQLSDATERLMSVQEQYATADVGTAKGPVIEATVYLQSTIATLAPLYPEGGAADRAFKQFLADVADAPKWLADNVVMPVVAGTAKFTAAVLWATIRGFWPLILGGILVLVVLAFIRRGA